MQGIVNRNSRKGRRRKIYEEYEKITRCKSTSSIAHHQPLSNYEQEGKNDIVPVCLKLQYFLRMLRSLGIKYSLLPVLQGFEQNQNLWPIFFKTLFRL